MADEEAPEGEVARVRPSAEERDILAGGPGQEDKADAEARQFASGKPARDLQREAEEGEADRIQRFRDHFEWAMIGTLWVVVIGYLAMAGVWAFNLCLPEAMRPLSSEELTDLGGVLTGGLLIGLLSKHFEKRTA